MEASSTNRNDSREAAQGSHRDCILDRKIEMRGLQESFSSNLGGKGASPAGTRVSDRSVQAMVRLFEKPTGTSDNPPTSRPGQASGTSDEVSARDGKGSRRGSRMSDNSGNHDAGRDRSINPQQAIIRQQRRRRRPQGDCSKSATPSALPSAQVTYQVEEYSLTLLKHKSYFNNRPLARCLDGYRGEDEGKEIQQVRSKKEGDKETSIRGKKNARNENGWGNERNFGAIPLTQNDASSPTQQLDSLMNELLTWKAVSKSSTPNSAHNREERDPFEIQSFWNNVRIQLWIEEEDIYGERVRSTGQGGGSVCDGGIRGHALIPSTSASTFPTCHSDSEPDPTPPPAPTTPPPPVPVAPRGRSFSVTPSCPAQHPIAPSLESFPDPALDYPVWDQLPPTWSVRLGISAPDGPDDAALLSNEYFETELPTLPNRGRPRPLLVREPSHPRCPTSSSGSSTGRWTRAPTWRSPSSLRSSSPPPVPPLPVPIPLVPTSTMSSHHHRNGNHSGDRRVPQSSKASMSASFSTHSVAITDSSSRGVQTGRMPKTSTSCTAICSSCAGFSFDISAAAGSGAPWRRLTAEEKLSEIDAFLSPGGEDDGV